MQKKSKHYDYDKPKNGGNMRAFSHFMIINQVEKRCWDLTILSEKPLKYYKLHWYSCRRKFTYKILHHGEKADAKEETFLRTIAAYSIRHLRIIKLKLSFVSRERSKQTMLGPPKHSEDNFTQPTNASRRDSPCTITHLTLYCHA